ncbi:VOC family protein [Planctomonas psychrotolerans]|uniref:VOC family protein n=1 Tax=Planctomonas psychrotolerans TaxID=2528712 RepID=UPI00123C5A6A|nr:VOC family protein [Planctomonas psychrotolerans]
MASKIGNIVFDCADPRALSHFWSDVLGYPRGEYPDDMRAALLASGLTDDDLALRSVAIDPTGETPRLFFQKVPEGKVVKNRVHLDITATPGRRASPMEVDAEVDRVVALGATVQHKSDGSWGPYPEYHYVLADPEGNEFCIH